jgi:hypothetical protein
VTRRLAGCQPRRAVARTHAADQAFAWLQPHRWTSSWPAWARAAPSQVHVWWGGGLPARPLVFQGAHDQGGAPAHASMLRHTSPQPPGARCCCCCCCSHTGCGEFLKAQKPSVQLVAVEPSESPVLSGACVTCGRVCVCVCVCACVRAKGGGLACCWVLRGVRGSVGRPPPRERPPLPMLRCHPARPAAVSGGKPGPHKIQGIGAGFVPGVLKTSLVDEVVQVSDSGCARELLGVVAALGGRWHAPPPSADVRRQQLRCVFCAAAPGRACAHACARTPHHAMPDTTGVQ